MRRIRSWFSTSSSTSSKTQISLHSNLSESEKKDRLHHISSKESLCEQLVEEIHQDMAVLEKLYKATKDKKERKNIQNNMNQLTNDLYDISHKHSILRLEREVLEDFFHIDNEF